MQVQFKQTCNINGQQYHIGVHTVPDNVQSHWFLKALIKDGMALVIGKPSELGPFVEPESPAKVKAKKPVT